MPRVATRTRPAPAIEQGATRRTVNRYVEDLARGRITQRGAKLPTYQRPSPRVVLRASPLGRAIDIGISLGDAAYEYDRDRREALEDEELENSEYEFVDERDYETEIYYQVGTGLMIPEGGSNPFDMTGWTEKLAWQTDLSTVDNPPNFVYTVTGEVFWGDFWTSGVGIDSIPGDIQQALPYQEPFGGTWWRSFDDTALETAGEFTTTQWVSNTDGTSAPSPANDGWYRGSWTRNVGTVGAPTRIGGALASYAFRQVDPNIRRYLETDIAPYQIGYGTIAAPPVAKAFTRTVVMTRSGRDEINKYEGPPHTKQPPRKREKEKKTLTKAATIAVGVFKALDTVSEWSELVDAFYDALPDDVKARWSKGREKRGLLDSAGQYGIDGADWKIQALWHNFHKIDGPQAFKNIVANEYQDKVLGLIHKNTPVNTGSATSGAMKEVNKEIERFLSTMGF